MQPGAEGSAVVDRAQVVGCAATATGQVLPEWQFKRDVDCRKVAYGSARRRNEDAALSKATFRQISTL